MAEVGAGFPDLVRFLFRGLLEDVGQGRVGGVCVAGGGAGLVEQVHDVGDGALDQGLQRGIGVAFGALQLCVDGLADEAAGLGLGAGCRPCPALRPGGDRRRDG